MNITDFNDEITQEIIRIEKAYAFEENYLLIQLTKLLKYDIKYYEYESKRQKTYSRSSIKNKLCDTKKLIEKLEGLLELEPCIELPSHVALKTILQKYKSETIELDNSIKTKSGRPPGSMKKFLMFHLLRIYLAGTKLPMQCYPSSYSNGGAGKTYELFIEIKAIFFQINNGLNLGTDNSIYACANVLNKKFERLHQYMY